ncbi:hypothetical protein GT94_13800 [Geobacillus stearothermophilus]|nr:hypothetical protein ET31_10000 [Geobacillus stearothermophilus]KFX32897.1 hypothetical protein GT94_13800 [Geobacillus stearothermophilus]
MAMDEQTLLEQLRKNPPKLVGGYKKQGWAIKVLERIANPDVEDEGDGRVTAKAVLRAQDGTYYPAFLTIDLHQQGRVVGVYFIAENKEQFDLIPFEWAKEFLGKPEQAIIPFRYRTLSKIDGDKQQTHWPDFS